MAICRLGGFSSGMGVVLSLTDDKNLERSTARARHRGRARPPKPRRDLAANRRENGVAPGHECVFAAYSFGVGVIGLAFVHKYLR